MKLGADVCRSQGMNPAGFGDPLFFPLAPLTCLALSEISQQQLDGLSGNVLQILMVPTKDESQ